MNHCFAGRRGLDIYLYISLNLYVAYTLYYLFIFGEAQRQRPVAVEGDPDLLTFSEIGCA
jgi:hypothetical protein